MRETLNIYDGPNDWAYIDVWPVGERWAYKAEVYFDGGYPDSYSSQSSFPSRAHAIKMGLLMLRAMIGDAHPDGFPPFLDELLKAHEPNEILSHTR